MSKHRDPLEPAAGDAVAVLVAERLRRLIAKKGRSFERLAELSGIDPSELMRIEAGAVTPTINHLWRIANALGISFGSLVASQGRRDVLVFRKGARQSVASDDGKFRTRPLFPYDSQRTVEFYEVEIAPHHRHSVEAHAPGTKENLVIARGSLEVIVGREAPQKLGEGDAIDFLADVPHSYHNASPEAATAYLVISYDSASGEANN
ncbi:XRE family transcriptional regulator [Methylocystis echinoides]|uniref:helix-turn-helix domain-containing protein n=1 Tax=Methylocystis echinoides TaxID=29468 RepID=UPI003421848D